MDSSGWRWLDGKFWMPVLLLLMGTGCDSGNPYSQVQVSGSITYDDGELIPAEMIILKFEPLSKSRDAKTFPPAGMSYVDVENGLFDVVTSYKYADGLVCGKHRVLVVATSPSADPADLVPPEYMDSKRTPLEIDTENAPFKLLIRKP